MATYTDLDEALKAVDVAVMETVADNPELAPEADSVYWDMAQSIMSDCSPSVARELSRVTGVDLPQWGSW